jgi:hypothetical protein
MVPWSRSDALHLAEACVSGALTLLWFAITLLNSRQKAVRTALPAFLLFLVHTTVALALFHGHAKDYARPTGAIAESLLVSLLLSALLKVYPMVAFGSTLLLAGSLASYTFATLLPSDDGYQTGSIVVGGVMALVSVLLYMYAPGRRSFWYTVVVLVATTYYVIVLAAIVYGPTVLAQMGSFENSLMWALSTLLALILITFSTRFLYVPADFRAVTTAAAATTTTTTTSAIEVDPSDDRPLNVHAFSDVWDFFSYVLETGRYAPPLPHQQ